MTEKDFMFLLTKKEVMNLMFQFGTSSWGKVEKHDGEITAIFDAIRNLMTPSEKPKRRIGFHAN